MPISVRCECGAKLNAPDAAAGKRVKCPKCAAVLTVPAPEDDFEIVDDDPAPPTKRPNRVDDDEHTPPRRSRQRDEDDEEDDRPAKRRARRDEDDEDDDDRPRPRKKKGKKAAPKSNLPLLLGIGGGVLALAVVGVVVAFVVLSKDDKQAKGPNTTPGKQPSALQNNWVDVDKPEFAAKFLADGVLRDEAPPGGGPNGVSVRIVGKELPGGQGGQMVMVMTLPPAQAAMLANDPNKVLTDALRANPLTAGKTNAMQPTTVAGQPAQAFVFEERGITNHVRVLIVNTRMYMLMAGGRGLAESDEKVTVFFDNFRPK